MGIMHVKDWARVLSRAGIPAFIVGGHGIGKTSAIYQLYREAAMEAGYRIENFLPGSRVFVGFDWASGDKRTGGNVQTFNHLFPLGHKYLGFQDTIGRRNIYDVSVGFSIEPVEKTAPPPGVSKNTMSARTIGLSRPLVPGMFEKSSSFVTM